MNKEIRQDKLAVYGLIALFALLTCLWMPVNYNVNDDVELEGILSGMYTGSPDGHAIYIRAILAYPLSWLYRLLPMFNWYGILLCVLQWMGLGLLIGRVRKRLAKQKSCVLVIGIIFLIFFIAVWENYVSITYTTTAGILLAMTLFWYLTGDLSICTQAITALLVLLALSLRFQFAPVILSVGGICWLLKVHREGIRRNWQLPAMLGAGLLLMAGCQHLAYGSTQWQEFLAFNDARTEVYDFTGIPPYEESRDFYNQYAAGQQIFEALDVYDLTGRPEVTTELLERVAEYQSGKNRTRLLEEVKQAIGASLVSFFMDQYGESLSPLNLLMVIFWIVFLVTSIRRKSYDAFIAGVGVLVMMGAMWLYLAWQGRLLYRVLFVMQLLMIMAAAGLWLYGGETLLPQWMFHKEKLLIMAVLLLIPATMQGVRCYEREIEVEMRNEDRALLEDYFTSHPEQFYFLTTPLVAPITDDVSLFTHRHPMNYADLGGWIVKSPLYDKRLQRAGIEDKDIREVLLAQKGSVITSGRNMSYLFSDRYEEEKEIQYLTLEYLENKERYYYIHQYVVK